MNEVDVKQILLEMRQYRIGLIQTPEQLRFSYQAIIEGAKKLLNKNSNNIDDEVINTTIYHRIIIHHHPQSFPNHSNYPDLQAGCVSMMMF